MKIRNFIEFIKEELNIPPEQYIKHALGNIQTAIDDMFKDQKEVESESKSKSIKQAKEDAKEDSKEKSFRALGVRLDAPPEISTYSVMHDTLTIKFSDDDFTYSLIILIDLNEVQKAMIAFKAKDPKKDFSFKDIEKCSVIFKKYDLDVFKQIGAPLIETVDIKDIKKEEFLVNLKIKLDELNKNDNIDKGGEELEFET